MQPKLIKLEFKPGLTPKPTVFYFRFMKILHEGSYKAILYLYQSYQEINKRKLTGNTAWEIEVCSQKRFP